MASVLLMIYLYLPLAIAVLYAFNDSRSLTWPPAGFSLRWFRGLVEDAAFRSALGTSLVAAVATAVMAGIVGTAAALAIARTTSFLTTLADALGRLPVMLPALFVGVGLVSLMQATGSAPSLLLVVAGHLVVALPFVMTVILASLTTFDPELELAARDLGASPFEVLRRVTLPNCAPAIGGAMLLAFAISFDEILITNFTSGSSVTVPAYIYAKLRRFIDPGANAVAAIMVVIPWVSLGLGALLLRRSGAGKALVAPEGGKP